jgi:hypothetical protein
LHADGVTVRSSAFLDSGFRATGHAKGAVRLAGGKITGKLNMSHATLISQESPALNAEKLAVGRGIYLDLVVSSSFPAPPVDKRVEKTQTAIRSVRR